MRALCGRRCPDIPLKARRQVALLLASLFLLPAACEDPETGDALSIEAIGAVGGQLLFDANGNGSIDQGDQPLGGWTVNLDQTAGGTVASGITDEEGVVVFEEVPVGQLVPGVPVSELGDTLTIFPSSAEPFTLGAFETAEIRPLLSLPSHTVEEVRELAPGKPVFTEGVALNVFSQGDLSLHIKASDQYLRVLSVDLSSAFSVGDSIRVRGRTLLDQGVPVLDGQAVYRLATSSQDPVPISLTTGEAAGARGGRLDAALVVIGNADIEEVFDEGDDGVRLIVDDGSGPLSLRFRSSFNVDPDLIDPEIDDLGYVVGLLVPVRIGEDLAWEIRPRTTSEVVLYRPGG